MGKSAKAEGGRAAMNKRIRKKQLRRALIGLLAAYDEYEVARERAFHKAMQAVTDTCENPRDVLPTWRSRPVWHPAVHRPGF